MLQIKYTEQHGLLRIAFFLIWRSRVRIPLPFLSMEEQEQGIQYKGQLDGETRSWRLFLLVRCPPSLLTWGQTWPLMREMKLTNGSPDFLGNRTALYALMKWVTRDILICTMIASKLIYETLKPPTLATPCPLSVSPPSIVLVDNGSPIAITPENNSTNTTMKPRPLATYSIAPPGFQSGQQPAQQAFSPQQQALLSGTVQGSTPANGQATLLPQAFNTMTLRDPTDANWNMDTGASSHLNSNATNLSTLFNSCMYPSVLVGDGKSIPVTNTGHSTLPTPYRPLHLNNVLITPNIVKNLISVRQFVRDNKCTIEFDEFGFSVKDYWTRQILLRCDSTGDLYPVTSLAHILKLFWSVSRRGTNDWVILEVKCYVI
ncbi:hypothetical protein Tco_0950456 [Tanacetum coccineum]